MGTILEEAVSKIGLKYNPIGLLRNPILGRGFVKIELKNNSIELKNRSIFGGGGANRSKLKRAHRPMIKVVAG